MEAAPSGFCLHSSLESHQDYCAYLVAMYRDGSDPVPGAREVIASFTAHLGYPLPYLSQI